MGDAKLTDVVADTGPLIHLNEIDCLPFLNIFNTLHIPDAVWHESVAQNRIPEGSLSTINKVRRHAISQPDVARFADENALTDLHRGELECIGL